MVSSGLYSIQNYLCINLELEEFDQKGARTKSKQPKTDLGASQKEKLEQLVAEMEHKLVQRDDVMDEKEKIKAKKMRKVQLALK